jgi:hypothetical protein
MFPIEAFRGTLERFIGILRSLEIRHHLTGGVVSVAWGDPSQLAEICIESFLSPPVPQDDNVPVKNSQKTFVHFHRRHLI